MNVKMAATQELLVLTVREGFERHLYLSAQYLTKTPRSFRRFPKLGYRYLTRFSLRTTCPDSPIVPWIIFHTVYGFRHSLQSTVVWKHCSLVLFLPNGCHRCISIWFFLSSAYSGSGNFFYFSRIFHVLYFFVIIVTAWIISLGAGGKQFTFAF